MKQTISSFLDSIPSPVSILLSVISSVLGVIVIHLVWGDIGDSTITLLLFAIVVVAVLSIALQFWTAKIIHTIPQTVQTVVEQGVNLRLFRGDASFDQFRRLFQEANHSILIYGGGSLLGLQDNDSTRTDELDFYEKALARSVSITRIQRKTNSTILWNQSIKQIKDKFPHKFAIYWDDKSEPSISLNVFDEKRVLIEIVETDLGKILAQGDGTHEVSTSILVDDVEVASSIQTALLKFTSLNNNCTSPTLEKHIAAMLTERIHNAESFYRRTADVDVREAQKQTSIPDFMILKDARDKITKHTTP